MRAVLGAARQCVACQSIFMRACAAVEIDKPFGRIAASRLYAVVSPPATLSPYLALLSPWPAMQACGPTFARSAVPVAALPDVPSPDDLSRGIAAHALIAACIGNGRRGRAVLAAHDRFISAEDARASAVRRSLLRGRTLFAEMCSYLNRAAADMHATLIHPHGAAPALDASPETPVSAVRRSIVQ